VIFVSAEFLDLIDGIQYLQGLTSVVPAGSDSGIH